MGVSAWVCTPNRNELKLGTVGLVVFDIVSQPTDFGIKRAWVRVGESVPN